MAGSAVAPRPDHPTLDNLTLARKEGWAAFVNAAPRRRPESLTRSAISALGDAAANEYNLRRREWHANLGPLKTPQLVALHEDLWDILDSNLQDGDKAKSAVAIDAFPGPHPSTDPQDGPPDRQGLCAVSRAQPAAVAPHAGANVAANLLRNVWAYVVICCGHFADGAEKFTPAALEGETKPQWYLRQMLGSANFNAGPVMAFLSGTCATRSNTTSTLTCRVIATQRSLNGCGRCAPPMTCPTPPVRWLASTCSRCAQCASWPSRIGSCPPPPTTHPRQRPRTSSATSKRCTCQAGAMTMRGDAD